MYNKELQGLPINLPTVRDGDIFLRYNVQAQAADSLYRFAKGRGVLFGRWYSNVIDPKGVVLEKIGYVMGSCPNAEMLARLSLNLPTYPRMSVADARRVAEIIKEYFAR